MNILHFHKNKRTLTSNAEIPAFQVSILALGGKYSTAVEKCQFRFSNSSETIPKTVRSAWIAVIAEAIFKTAPAASPKNTHTNR